jgi:two-component system OmpR family sensor kinase
VGLAVWLAASHEVDELLDEALRASGELMAALATGHGLARGAAHGLRRPARLAVAARTAPPGLAERLVRVRSAAARLQHVVAALLGLFRSADGTAALQRHAVGLDDLVQRLPPFALSLQAEPGSPLDADADLVAAALLNLFDNAQRHGAREVRLSVAEGGRVLKVRDDGRSIAPERRAELARALAEERYADTGGLGLMLADRVARAHGGRLTLPAVDRGFAADLELGPR